MDQACAGFSTLQPAGACQCSGRVGLGVPGVERQAPTTAADHIEAGRHASSDRPSDAIGALGAAHPPFSAHVCNSPQLTCPSHGPIASLPATRTQPVESSMAQTPSRRESRPDGPTDPLMVASFELVASAEVGFIPKGHRTTSRLDVTCHGAVRVRRSCHLERGFRENNGSNRGRVRRYVKREAPYLSADQ